VKGYRALDQNSYIQCNEGNSPKKFIVEVHSCNNASILLKNTKWKVKVNYDIVKAKMVYLQYHLVTASFIGNNHSPFTFNPWLTHLNYKVRGQSNVRLLINKGFFLFKIDGPNIVDKVLMFTWFKTSQGCAFSKDGFQDSSLITLKGWRYQPKSFIGNY
jgi:hypothetical protein